MAIGAQEGQGGWAICHEDSLGLNGPLGTTALENKAISNFVEADVKLERQVEQFWKIETSGILAWSVPQLSADDQTVLKVWRQSIKLKEGHYQLDVPFKSNPPSLLSNSTVAEKRLQSLGRRLTKDPQLHARYKAGIEELVAKGYAEKVPENERLIPHLARRGIYPSTASPTWTSLRNCVLCSTVRPRAVVHPWTKKSSKVQTWRTSWWEFFCASGRAELLWWATSRPCFIRWKFPTVIGMRCGFSGGRTAWWDNDRGSTEWQYTCLAASGVSFALKRVAEDHRDEFYPETIATVCENFYADDRLKALSTEAEAIRIVKQLCGLLAMGGFRLTKWIRNSRDVIEAVPYEGRAKEVKDLDLDRSSLPVVRALGIQWNTATDEFGLKIRQKEKEHTRRGLMSVVSSVYDPLGSSARLCWERRWSSKTSASQRRYGMTLWIQEINGAGRSGLKTFRCWRTSRLNGSVVDCTLHHFADASQVAYGSASYLRLVNGEGGIHCAFLLGKSRLALIKQLSIPRLELCVAVPLSRSRWTTCYAKSWDSLSKAQCFGRTVWSCFSTSTIEASVCKRSWPTEWRSFTTRHHPISGGRLAGRTTLLTTARGLSAQMLPLFKCFNPNHYSVNHSKADL